MRPPIPRALARRVIGSIFVAATLLGAVGCRSSTSRAAQASTAALLPVGDRVPDISGLAQDGRHVSLREFAGKPLIVYFYPKDETKGCTIEAEGIRDSWKDLEATGAVVIGVSADDDASHREFTQHHQLPFVLLSDSDHKIARAFGVPVKNGVDQRVTFVVGKDGKIAKVFPTVDPRAHAAELVAAVRAS